MPAKTTPKEWDEVRTAFATSIMVDTSLSSLAQNLDGPDWPIKGADETPAKYIDLSHEEVIEALTVDKLATLLPRDQLGAIIAASLKKDEKFGEAHLLEVVPPSSLVKHIPLDYIWDRVIGPLVAERHEYAERPGAAGKATEAKPTGAAKLDEPTWTAPPPASARGEEDSDLVGEDEIMEDAFDGADEGPGSKGAALEAKKA